MFNHLAEVCPKLAEEVRGTEKDPFYVSELSHPNWDRFVTHLERRWFEIQIQTPETIKGAVG